VDYASSDRSPAMSLLRSVGSYKCTPLRCIPMALLNCKVTSMSRKMMCRNTQSHTDTWVNGLTQTVHTHKNQHTHVNYTGIHINTNIHSDSEFGTHIHMHTQ
jgi:hypothetical protein